MGVFYGSDSADNLNAVIYGLSDDQMYGYGGNDTLYGDDGNDTLYGGIDNETLYGDNGNDILYGDAGNDYIVGGLGNDTLFGGDGNDLLIGGFSVNDGINDTTQKFLDGGNGSDTLYGANSNDALYGASGNDALYALNGNDTLNGYGYTANEDDVLWGGTGTDLFVLGTSADVFYTEYDTSFLTGYQAGQAVIADFSQEQGDKIQLKGNFADYTFANEQYTGSAALDTSIYYWGDLVGVVMDFSGLTQSDCTFV